MNKYGPSSLTKVENLFYKDGKMTGEFDPLEDPKHSRRIN